MRKRPDTPDPLAALAADQPPPADLWASLRAALSAGDAAAAREAVDNLDVDPLLLPMFGAAVTDHAELSAIIQAGAGQREEAQRLESERDLLQRTRPNGAAEARQIVEQISATTAAWSKALGLAGTANQAAWQLGCLEAGFPELFGIAAVPRLAMLPERTAAEAKKLGFDSTEHTWTELVRPTLPLTTRPRRRARAIGGRS